MVKCYDMMKAGLCAGSVRRAVALLTPGPALSVCLFMLLAAPTAWGATVIIPTPQPATTGLACIGTRAGASLGCTAKEFTVGSTFSAAPGTPPFCVAGNSFDFLVDLELYGSNADRYDIGFYVGESYNAPDINDSTKTCSVTAFPTAPAPYANLDGINTCGDYIKAGDSIIRINKIRVKCQGDATGTLSVPYTLTYDQNGGNPSCDGSNPATLPIPTTSKCQTGASPVAGTVKVYSGAYVDVKKLTVPSGDSQPFSFTATGPSVPPASTVIALTGSTTLGLPSPTDGTYTPPTITAATNTTTVTMTDGQTARFYINALAASQTLTIAEAATTNWETTAAILCSAVTGSPALTTNNATRTITAALNSTDSAATCTITNTKRSRITLTKSVGGRRDPADQFTVSASGGGTLTGTTSATTSGSGTSASTTFYSTPNTALTLTDAKASGPTILANYETRLTCTNAFTGPGATPNASLPNNLSTATTTFTPAPGDDISCIYTNTPKLTLSKSFSTGTIGVGRTATLTFTVANPAGAPARTGGLTFTDMFPANLAIAGAPNVTNTCGGAPTITATAGSGAFIVGGTGLNAPAGPSTCTISVDVTSSAPLAGYVNGAAQIIAIADSFLNGVTSQALNVVQGSLTKAFSPTTIDQGEISTLTFTLTNGTGNPAQSGINFTDNLPSNVTVATTPNITTTCPSGTGIVTAPAGAGSIVIAGAAMNSTQASCVITVDVTGNTPGGPYNNTSASISGTANITNSVTTSGLIVRAKPTLTKAFSTGTIGVGQTATLTFTITNPAGAPARTGLTFTDSFPANLVIAGTPNVVNNCGGTPTITGGAGTFTVGGTGVNAAAGASSCTISVNVASSIPLSGYVNGSAQITAISGTLLNGVTDQTLSVTQASLTKVFSPTSIVPGGRSTLTFTLANGTGNPAQTGINFTDTLPTYVTVASPPNVTTTCPSGTGVVAAAAGAGSIVVTGAAMSNAQASCVISVDVTGTTLGGPYNNTSASISGTARVANSVVTSSLTIQTNSTVTIRKVSSGGVGTFSFTGTNGIANTALTTVTAGVPVSSAVQTFSALNTQTTITESMPLGWALTGATCVDGSNNPVPNTTLSNGTLTVPAAAIVAGATLTCTFTNILPPSLTVVKSASPSPGVNPGQVVTYTSTVSNTGQGTATNVVLTDFLPPYVCWGVDSYGAGVAFQFSDGTPASGLALGTPVYSKDNGSTWSYTPASGGGGAPAGFDGNVTNWRIPMNGTMSANGANFTVRYQVQVK